jgi:hypothetical protein
MLFSNNNFYGLMASIEIEGEEKRKKGESDKWCMSHKGYYISKIVAARGWFVLVSK